MSSYRLCLAAAFAALVVPTFAADPIDARRIEEIAALLPAQPRGVGRPVEDRAAWEAMARLSAFAKVIPAAEKLAAQPVPDVPDELYLDFSKTGNRRRFETAEGKRHSRISQLALAECLENRGRFLPGLEASIRAACAEKSWTLPAHDRKLDTFSGRLIDIDLWVAGNSWELATVHYWLGKKLNPEVRTLLEKELLRRCFEPFRSAVRTGKPKLFWMTATHNWNAVCLAGVSGAALAVLPDRQERAWFVAAAEKYVQNFLRGFTPDGYCSEGMGYWNYGFGNFVLMSETVNQATGGKIDWLESDVVRQVALFGRRLEILPGLYPSFADCPLYPRPETRLFAFLSRRFGWGLKEVEDAGLLLGGGPSGSVVATGVYCFPNAASKRPTAKVVAAAPRDWFSDAGILICRPADQSTGMGVALKGGHNAEHHNHNDVGSFAVALGKSLLLLDPGGEVYTARTFSSRRYESQVLNSFGHPVPMVAGQLQRPGRDAQAKLLSTSFTEQEDRIAFDLTSAYPVKELKRLVRTFVYSRAGRGRLTVTDEVSFSAPQKFGTALVTLSPWTKTDAGLIEIGKGAERVRASVVCKASTWQVQAEELHEDISGKRVPVRLGINLDKPVSAATLSVTIEPASP